jgi:hypothetical protein
MNAGPSDLPPSREISAADAIELHNLAIAENALLIWAVTYDPADHPDKFVARPHLVAAAREGAFLVHLVADTLEGVRAQLPPGLIPFARAPTDDPVIIESWL